MTTCQEDDFDDGMTWKPRCPKCFSRELDFNYSGRRFDGIDATSGRIVKLGRCKECGVKFDMNDAELTMPMTGGYMDVPNGAEEEI
jgi:predicted Zn-ribbon and HTH transcriptional regulator